MGAKEKKKKPQKLVRRARRSLPERRMKECLRDLATNLEKVENRAFLHNKKKREKRRKALGIQVEGVPTAVQRGRMFQELYEVECALHKEVGLPPPSLPAEGHYPSLLGSTKKSSQPPSSAQESRAEETAAAPKIGLISFESLAERVKLLGP